jgi:ubiquinol-cytochrome c reductase core subunit 2
MVASRDIHGPTTTLAIIAKAGTRYQPLPGLTVGLEEFAFKVSSVLTAYQTSELIYITSLGYLTTLCLANHPRNRAFG